MKRLTAVTVLVFSLAASADAAYAQAQGQARPAAPGQAAAAQGEIRGVVVDAESGAPISAASVSVHNKADNALITGAIAQQNGTFRIEGLRPGTYVVKFTMIGYGTQVTPELTISAASPRTNLGSMRLTRQAVEVEGVTATAEKALIIQPDRNTYRVKEVAPAATNASEVLDNVPSVSVDADGKVSLRGNENVVVQINGRPTPIRGDQLANYLKQLPSNTIERVEVVPNPSAKQDPEGMAGIINIVMKQGVDLGTSGGINASASTAERYNIGGNLGHQSGPLAVSANYGYFSDVRQMLGINDRTRFGAAKTPLSYTEQDLSGDEYNGGHNATVNADYTFSKKDVLATTVQFNRRHAVNDAFNNYFELTGSRAVTDEYDRVRDSGNANTMYDAMLNFKRTMVPQKHEISAEVRFNRQFEDDHTQQFRSEVTGNTLSDFERNVTDGNTRQITGQIDYTKLLTDNLKLEAGWKGNRRVLGRDFEVQKDPEGDGTWVLSDLSNEFELTENVNAVYAVFSKSGKKVDWQAGLRGEYASRTFFLANTDEEYPDNYTSLYPSALVNFKLNDKSQAKLSYSRRVRRPGSFELNPFPNFFDLNNVFLGNPDLAPEYTSSVEASYQRSGTLGSLQIAPFYRYTNNIIRFEVNTADTVNNREVTSINFMNLDHSSSWGMDVNAQLRPSQKLSIMPAFNVFKMVTDGGSTSALQSNAVNWTFRMNANYAATPQTSLLANWFYRGPMTFETGKFSSFSMLNLTIRQKLSSKLTAMARVQDPFDQMKFTVDVGDDNIRQLTERQFNARALHLTVQYNFGQTPRLKQRRQDDQQAPASAPFGG